MSVQLEMANTLKSRDLSAVTRTPHHVEATSLLNRRLKLPPISPNANLIQNNGSASFQQRQQRQQLTAFANSINLPRLDMCSLELRRYGSSHEQNSTRTSKDVDCPILSFPRVYSVLPPIGKKLTPTAPSVSKEDAQRSRESSKSSISTKKRSVRRHRIKRQVTEKAENVSETTVVDNSCENNSVIQDEDRPKRGSDEGFAIHIPDVCLPADKETDLYTVEERERSEVASNPDEDSQDLIKIDHVPKDLRPYADIYPPSPPPGDRRAKNLVVKKRQEIREVNRIRMTFLEEGGRTRRNATCAELDDVLKNAVELLRELFLRKTMEELCMLW